ncbi:unnamed protein product [Pleuronectes platessa]|uniref:Uncharacterized protein n=1 Tax=Pleuronectes platessa TaxID=8262 RepID=A0A9N7YAL5_PLEPL|nr:unnamed protein product [Pleuronectes platessa]
MDVPLCALRPAEAPAPGPRRAACWFYPCALVLVYNGGFSIATREANDTRTRQHEQLRRPTEAPPAAVALKPHPPVLQGYSGIIDHKQSSTCTAL